MQRYGKGKGKEKKRKGEKPLKNSNTHLDVLSAPDRQAPALGDRDALGLERDGAVGESAERVV
jgi:hypothetical protein